MNFLMIASYPQSILGFRGKLIEALQSQGFEVHLAAPGLTNKIPIGAELIKRGVTIHNIPMYNTGMNPLHDLKTIYALFFLIKKIKPDYVLSYTIKPVIYGSIAACLAKVPKVFGLITGLGAMFIGSATSKKSKILRKLAECLYRFSLRKVTGVFFQNPDDQVLFQQRQILSSNVSSMVVNGSGVDLTHYIETEHPSIPCFLLIARLLGDKGIREYVAAAKQLKQKYPEVKFLLAGPFDNNPAAIAKQELDDWIAEGAIDYLGPLDDVRSAITEASVYVLPSYREGTPRTVLEAMAMGRAIITTDAPGCRETVIEGKGGFLVPIKSVDKLVKAIERFIVEPDLAQIMGKQSRKMAERKYDVDKVNAIQLQYMGL